MSASSSEVLNCLIQEKCPQVDVNRCICNACRLKYMKKLKSVIYTPEKSRKVERPICFLSHFLICDQVSQADIACLLTDFNNAFSLEALSIPQIIPICFKHRAQLHNVKNKVFCSVCGCNLKLGKKYPCATLSEESVDKLRIVNDEFSLEENTVLCPSCQRYALRKNSAGKSMKELQQQFMRNVSASEGSEDEDKILSKILNMSYLDISRMCESSKSFLLSSAYDCFLTNVKLNITDQDQYHDFAKTKTFFLTKILEEFGDLLKIHRLAKKKGIFFYLSDLSVESIIEAWHNSSFENRLLKLKSSKDIETEDSSNETNACTSIEMNTHFRNLIVNCNHSLFIQGKQIREHYLQNPSSVINFQLTDLYNSFNPLVWNVISMLTATKEENKHFQNSSVLVDKEYIHFPSYNTKSGEKRKCKRIIATCLLQFILSDENSYPLQIAIGTLIKRLSKSSKLIQLCNNLGLTCSEDTLERYWQQQYAFREKLGITSSLFPNVTTVVSLDNVDVRCSFAAVKANAPRSWHGTSAMAQQPKPITEKLHFLEILKDDDLTMDVDIDKNVHTDDDGASTSTCTEKESHKFISEAKKPVARKRIRLDECALPSSSISEFRLPPMKTFIRSQLTEYFFSCSEADICVFKDFFKEMFIYVAERFSLINSDLPIVLPSFKCKLAFQDDHEVEKSKFAYLFVLDEKADCPVTLKHCLGILYDTFQIGQSVNHLIVAGDGATVKLLLNLKKEYGQALDWMIPFLGDWHTLKNYQEVLMKIFWHAGLKDVAKSSHKKMTLQSLATCSSFKRTHRFIMQSYEAVFMCLINSFLEHRQGKEVTITNEHFIQLLSEVVSCVKFDEGKHTGMDKFKDAEQKLLSDLGPLIIEFDSFCENMSQKCETFKFWHQFLREDCFAYISLHTAMRKGDWNLRIVSLKKMAPIFQAFDRLNYASLIPAHLKMIGGLPGHIKEHFERGAFVSSISGSNFSQVGFDECHEMLINKDVKMALSHSLPKDMDKLAGTVQQQAQLIHNLEEQLGIEKNKKYQRDLDISVIRSEYENVKLYYSKLENNIFEFEESKPLFQLFTKKSATSVQQKCLLNYRQMGEDAFLAFCQTSVLGDTSVRKPVTRRFNLKTFAKEKVRQKKVTDLEKENKLITLCYKRTIAHSQETNKPISDLCQFLTVPRAICASNGLPYKGAKYIIYNYFDKRYNSHYEIIKSTFQVQPNSCVIIEGMNIIYTSPLKHFKCFKDYADFIVMRWVSSNFKKGFKEVRILFDQVNTQGLSPKGMERSRRDEVGDEEEETFEYIDDDVPLPNNWMKFLKRRSHKHMLCRYLSNKFIDIVPSHFKNAEQVFITSGGFHVGLESSFEWSGKLLSASGSHTHHLVHNHEESDTQIWLHALDSQCSNILIYSIDRDIAMIGLPLDFAQNKSVIIQFDAKVGHEKFLNLINLQLACENDSDLSQLKNKGIHIRKCLQMLYICSGCDFVSFFAHNGKTTFLKLFFQYGPFITANSPETHGTLCESSLNENFENGLLSFYRLILCVYYHSNRACLHNFNSPIDLYNSVSADNVLEQHIKALDVVRRASWKGVYEDGLLPSSSALRFHWMRACWVQTVWSKTESAIFFYPDINLYGYTASPDSGIVTCKWDSQENIDKIKSNVIYLTRGCACAKSKCATNICKCKKEKKYCGPGCRCKQCTNIEHTVEQNHYSSESEEDTEENESYTSHVSDNESDIESVLGEITDHSHNGDSEDSDEDIL
nr:uncharacterized protein LOC129261272 [Lytechinus pictus]